MIRQDKKNSPNYFRKIIIKNRDSKKCRKFLSKLGVTPKHLFPNSIDGAVEYCNSFIPIKFIAPAQIITTFTFIYFDVEKEVAKVKKNCEVFAS
ncbi:hypothetical protein [Legionella sainthelensi]|uniref:hypothetical protein n=1 Tax=Legionella sainthelensi TaxID=28087 RepID=UPI000E2004E3|nr:hypothetical protein [Legionella sainthelensi]